MTAVLYTVLTLCLATLAVQVYVQVAIERMMP